jgi:tetratricopeptide (TPR) repeat protein
MKLEEWFSALRSKAETIERKWPTASQDEKLRLAEELFELRQVSDRVVDLWLQFEEKLSIAIRHIKQLEGEYPQLEGEYPPADASQPGAAAPAMETTDVNASSGTQHDDVSSSAAVNLGTFPADVAGRPFEHMYRKGEGFYQLRLYQDARQCFAELLKESPDWESGRLYYAYSLLFSEAREEALREFRLLSRSAQSPVVAAISYNAIGCMLAEERQWLEAAQAFKTALEHHPEQREARFNLALCYLQDDDVQEALETIESLLHEGDSDWEAQLLWLRAARILQARDESAQPLPPDLLKLPTRKLDSETLREMASLYESLGNYHRAQVCYHFLVERFPREGWAWHGLAWNTWLIAGTRRALTLMKKAISLAPDNPDFTFSYGWMLLFDGRVDDALATFRSILSNQRDHRLAQSGLITAYERLGDTLTAKRLAAPFTEDGDPYIRSLGYYHLGRIAVAEENWRLAEHYFRRVLPHSGHFQEIPLYLQLCAAKLGGPTAASELLQPETVTGAGICTDAAEC